jgi:hypothetical protein
MPPDEKSLLKSSDKPAAISTQKMATDQRSPHSAGRQVLHSNTRGYRGTSRQTKKSSSTGLNPLTLDLFADQIKHP